MPTLRITVFVASLCLFWVIAALACGTIETANAGSVRSQPVRSAATALPITTDESYRSQALGGVFRYEVTLPAGYYVFPYKYYPVVYALHGLPGNSRSYQSLRFLLPIFRRLDAQAIVVFPQGAADSESDDEYQDIGAGRRWETAISVELPRVLASRYRILSSRRAHAIIGVSAGGYGAAMIGLHHLDEYAAIESWSGYFHATTPDGTQPMPLSPEQAQQANLHNMVPELAVAVRSQPALIAFYTGDHDPYPGFTDENSQFDRELSAARVPHRFAVYSGGHDFHFWSVHAQAWLHQLLGYLAPPALRP